MGLSSSYIALAVGSSPNPMQLELLQRYGSPLMSVGGIRYPLGLTHGPSHLRWSTAGAWTMLLGSWAAGGQHAAQLYPFAALVPSAHLRVATQHKQVCGQQPHSAYRQPLILMPCRLEHASSGSATLDAYLAASASPAAAGTHKLHHSGSFSATVPGVARTSSGSGYPSLSSSFKSAGRQPAAQQHATYGTSTSYASGATQQQQGYLDLLDPKASLGSGYASAYSRSR
jgi:hypothetical protein